MASQSVRKNEHGYVSLPTGDIEDANDSSQSSKPAHSLRRYRISFFTWLVISMVTGFVAGILVMAHVFSSEEGRYGWNVGGPQRIPLPTIERAFTYSSPFSLEPPQAKSSGAEPEPIWDTLVPGMSP
ncbi:hypothetical protein F4861DRAFT_497964 [Xylaria intraflava]|nr:hypothetical protein F4861DRAFT_497964 [Xylaria intraflava]